MQTSTAGLQSQPEAGDQLPPAQSAPSSQSHSPMSILRVKSLREEAGSAVMSQESASSPDESQQWLYHPAQDVAAGCQSACPVTDAIPQEVELEVAVEKLRMGVAGVGATTAAMTSTSASAHVDAPATSAASQGRQQASDHMAAGNQSLTYEPDTVPGAEAYICSAQSAAEPEAAPLETSPAESCSLPLHDLAEMRPGAAASSAAALHAVPASITDNAAPAAASSRAHPGACHYDLCDKMAVVQSSAQPNVAPCEPVPAQKHLLSSNAGASADEALIPLQCTETHGGPGESPPADQHTEIAHPLKASISQDNISSGWVQSPSAGRPLNEKENQAPAAVEDSSSKTQHLNGPLVILESEDANPAAARAVANAQADVDSHSCQAAMHSEHACTAAPNLGCSPGAAFESPNRASPDMMAAFAEAVACMRPSPSPCVSPFRRPTSLQKPEAFQPSSPKQDPSETSAARIPLQGSATRLATSDAASVGDQGPLSPQVKTRPTKIALSQLFEQSMEAVGHLQEAWSPSLSQTSSPPSPHSPGTPQHESCSPAAAARGAGPEISRMVRSAGGECEGDAASGWMIPALLSDEEDFLDESSQQCLDESSPGLTSSSTLTASAESLDG